MAPPDAGPRIFLIAGEVSGDRHGAELARALLTQAPNVRLEGIGGRLMAAAGVQLVEDSSTWGVMGWVDPIRQIRPFLRRLDAVRLRLLADPPQVLVPIDFSGFNLRLLKQLAGRIRAVYYVPPMVSVRRGRRAERVAALGARILPIFPFEADAYRRAGAEVAFVGHPAAELARSEESPEHVRDRLGVDRRAPVLGLLPGSRQAELDFLLTLMLEAAGRVRRAVPDLITLVAVASPLFLERIQRAAAASGLRVMLAEGAHDVMRASTVLLMASGTATVEAMVLGAPMVVTYRASWLNWWIAHLAVTTRRVAIPNIMAGQDVVPELLQSKATSPNLAAAVLALLRDPQARETQRAHLLTLAARLGPPGAAERAASEILASVAGPGLNTGPAVG